MEGLKEKYPGLTHNRIPVCNSAAPLEPDFDTICNALSGTNVNTPVIVNCQVNYYYLEFEKIIKFEKSKLSFDYDIHSFA